MPRRRLSDGPPSSYRLASLPVDPFDPGNPLNEGTVFSPTSDLSSIATPAPGPRMPTVDRYRNMTPAQQRRVLNTYGQEFLDALDQRSIQDAADYRSQYNLDAPEPPAGVGRDRFPEDFTYEGLLEDAIGEWNPDEDTYSHPDDSAFPPLNPADGPRSNNEPFRQYGGMDFFAGNNPAGNTFNIPQWINQYTQFPRGSPMGQTPVSGGDVITRHDGQTITSHTPGDATVGETQNQQQPLSQPSSPTSADIALRESGYAGGRITPQNRIGIGADTALNANLGSVHNPLFGVGSRTGQHYYNTGSGWQPIGQAPSDVRWAPNSGTGNYVASQTMKAYLAGGQQPGNPNNMSSAAMEGRFLMDDEGAPRMQGPMYNMSQNASGPGSPNFWDNVRQKQGDVQGGTYGTPESQAKNLAWAQSRYTPEQLAYIASLTQNRPSAPPTLQGPTSLSTEPGR